MELPDKVYFRIGEVARALHVEPHVVRFWQQQFPTVRPERSRTGRFLYTRATVEQLAFIQRLLKEEGYTISGAKKALRERGLRDQKKAPAPAADNGEQVEQLKEELRKARNERARLAAELDKLRAAVRESVDQALTALTDNEDG